MNTQHCGGCGSTFPATYWHECPGDQIAERAAQEIAAWLEREYKTIGPDVADVAEAIRAGAWRKP